MDKQSEYNWEEVGCLNNVLKSMINPFGVFSESLPCLRVKRIKKKSWMELLRSNFIHNTTPSQAVPKHWLIQKNPFISSHFQQDAVSTKNFYEFHLNIMVFIIWGGAVHLLLTWHTSRNAFAWNVWFFTFLLFLPHNILKGVDFWMCRESNFL